MSSRPPVRSPRFLSHVAQLRRHSRRRCPPPLPPRLLPEPPPLPPASLTQQQPPVSALSGISKSAQVATRPHPHAQPHPQPHAQPQSHPAHPPALAQPRTHPQTQHLPLPFTSTLSAHGKQPLAHPHMLPGLPPLLPPIMSVPVPVVPPVAVMPAKPVKHIENCPQARKCRNKECKLNHDCPKCPAAFPAAS